MARGNIDDQESREEQKEQAQDQKGHICQSLVVEGVDRFQPINFWRVKFDRKFKFIGAFC